MSLPDPHVLIIHWAPGFQSQPVGPFRNITAARAAARAFRRTRVSSAAGKKPTVSFHALRNPDVLQYWGEPVAQASEEGTGP